MDTNILLLSLEFQMGKRPTQEIMDLYAFLKLPTDDFVKIIKFKWRDWLKYGEYIENSHDITCYVEPNELYDKMIECEEASDTDDE